MTVDFKKEGHIALVGLNRPDALNALDAATLMALQKSWDEVAKDDQIRVAILYSAVDKIFCSGMDLKSFIPIFNGSRLPETEEEKWMIQDPANLFNAMLRQRTWDKPVIAAVNALCLTGGFEMVQGTDLRVAADTAEFQMKESTYGIMPIGGSNVFLPRQIPTAAAKEILLMGQRINSEQLLKWGFLNRVVPKDKLMDEAMGMAEIIASNGPLAVQGIMRCIRENQNADFDQAMAKELEIGLPIFSSEDSREGVKAFKEKRKPVYKGK